eukprot:CAMPEP_0202462086 /NCGR_PEP_ID=MMETSP1360-20130828/52433_1 /ASSEMBLY_ACC=CAM_ASM_000848 /TAXON_ID=515479 /ORGANISM="Licmophora paradoxa, Strain CCMP2313" /LENGTH=270 /DNA_ID=CAMNT_0049084407 /DNA_START=126 /DNA_END=938 /DNA_ORIENTATION=-
MNQRWILYSFLVITILVCSRINRIEKSSSGGGSGGVTKKKLRNNNKQPSELLRVYDFREGFEQPPHLTPLNVTHDLVPRQADGEEGGGLQTIDSTHLNGWIHTGSWLTIVDSNGSILVLKRGAHLVTCPNAWGLVGEHTLGDEAPIDTAKRGLREELGDEILNHIKSIQTLSEMPPFYFRDYGIANGNRIDRQVTYVWLIEMDQPGSKLPLHLDDEVADHKWLQPESLETWLQEGRHNLQTTGETGQRLCHETILTLWEFVMENYKKIKK